MHCESSLLPPQQRTPASSRKRRSLQTTAVLACVASVPERRERNSGRAKDVFDFGPRENGARAKRWKEWGGGGERRES